MDDRLYSYFALAEVLHRDVDEIMSWPSEMINWWFAYFKVKEHKRDTKRGHQESQAKLSRGRF
tara:strand:+ start:171 stop:359 length:189 start_codon:yes stop_codon:yes gene_type:complete